MKPRIIAYSNLYHEWIHPSTPYHSFKNVRFGGEELKTMEECGIINPTKVASYIRMYDKEYDEDCDNEFVVSFILKLIMYIIIALLIIWIHT